MPYTFGASLAADMQSASVVLHCTKKEKEEKETKKRGKNKPARAARPSILLLNHNGLVPISKFPLVLDFV